jgi:hypothetical protein
VDVAEGHGVVDREAGDGEVRLRVGQDGLKSPPAR